MTLLSPKIATSPAKVFSFRKVQEVSLARPMSHTNGQPIKTTIGGFVKKN